MTLFRRLLKYGVKHRLKLQNKSGATRPVSKSNTVTAGTSTRIEASAELGFDYTLKRSPRRRSLALSIRAGAVYLNAPMQLKDKDIECWLWEKREWVQVKLQQQNQRQQEVPERTYASGDTLCYLGKVYPLQVFLASGSGAAGANVVGSGIKGSGVEFSNERGFVVILGRSSKSRSQKGVAQRVQSLLQAWFKARAAELLRLKSESLCRYLGLSLCDVRLRRTKTKWGHCTSNGVIQYNWLILVAPDVVIDYLVAHEVCHLRHHHHGPAFWALVERVCPDFKIHKTWLRRYGHTLVV